MRNLKIKKILVICYAIVCLFCITGCKDTNDDELPKKNNITNNNIKSSFVSKSTTIEKNDGWIYYLEAKKNDDKIKYIFTGDNIKYIHLEGYTFDTLDENDNVIDTQLASQPSLIHSKESKQDVENINNFFNEKQFSQKITESDLVDLALIKIDKKDIVQLFNNLLDKQYVDVNKTLDDTLFNVGYTGIRQVKLDNETTIQYSYYIAVEGIVESRADIIIRDEFLSDIVEHGKATDEQKKMYDNMKNVADKIIEKQSFDVKNEFNDLKGKEYEALFKCIKQIIDSVKK